jgi:hypothetical protein
VTGLDRVRACGRFLHGGAEYVTVRVNASGVAGFTGLQTCGSVWACPVCSAAIRQGRSLEVEHAATEHARAGGRLVFVTFTLPHTVRDTLTDLLSELNGAWKRVQQSRGFRGRRAALGIASVRSLEVTYGRNGWHPHLHLLLFIDEGSDDALADLAGYLDAAWADAVERGGRKRPNEHGTRVQPVTLGAAATLAKYLTKVQDAHGDAWSVGAEMARGDLKSGRRHDSLTPFDLAEHAAAGDRRGLALWREYEEATRGRRCLTWTVGLRERYGLPDEVEDLALSEDGTAQAVAVLSPLDWRVVVGMEAECDLLLACENGGAPAVYAHMRYLWAVYDSLQPEDRHAVRTH